MGHTWWRWCGWFGDVRVDPDQAAREHQWCSEQNGDWNFDSTGGVRSANAEVVDGIDPGSLASGSSSRWFRRHQGHSHCHREARGLDRASSSIRTPDHDRQRGGLIRRGRSVTTSIHVRGMDGVTVRYGPVTPALSRLESRRRSATEGHRGIAASGFLRIIDPGPRHASPE